MAYFYRFLAMWLLASALLYALGALRFWSKELKSVENVATIWAICFACALFAFIYDNGKSLIGNLFGYPKYAVVA